MDGFHKVRLRLTALGQGSHAFIDDMEIRNLLSVSTECGLEKMTTITLTFYADVLADGEAAEVVRDVTSMDSDTRAFRHLRSEPSR